MFMSRRAVLRGAGALVALPFLESLRPLASAAGTGAAKPPLRLGIFTVTGGTVLESWKPTAVGPLTRLPSILRPLEAHRDDLLVISGLVQDGRSENLNAHEHCALLHLSAAPSVKREGGKLFSGISVDQAAARVVGRETFLPSLEMGLTSHETRYSFLLPDAPLPYEANPRLVFERLFRGRKPVVPNWKRRATAPADEASREGQTDSLDKSVLDLVMEQAKDLRRDLGRNDRHKLDSYLDSVRAAEKRLAFIEARQRQELRDLASPGPSRLNLPADLPPNGTPVWAITSPLGRDPEKHADYLRLMSDLMVLAFQTDSTRVATLAAGSDEALFPGVVTVGYEHHCHTLEHQGNAGRPEDADPIAREALRQIHVWYTTLFAEMVAKLKAIDEGGSSLLDNCLLLYTSYMADGGHGRDDYPVLLAGKAGGTLKTGRHVSFPKKAPMANLYVEVLNRMGVKVERFGDSHVSRYASSYKGRLPGLT